MAMPWRGETRAVSGTHAASGSNDVQRTPLFDEYAAFGAKATDFHGWALPIQFSGIIAEHHHTRRQAGLFDCSHMGEFLLRGEAALHTFDRLVFSDMIGLKPGRCRYTAILNDHGCIVDDCVGLRLSEDELYLVTNAAPLKQVAAMLDGPGVENVSDATAKLDVQGPASRQALLDIGLTDIAPLGYWTGRRCMWHGRELVVTRAGYTGELGYELFIPAEHARDLWRALIAHPTVLPCGLGARDTLRMEMCYPLNGQDLTEDTTPLEAAMDRFIAWDSDFLGKEALLAQRDLGCARVLTPIVSESRQAPRHGFEAYHDGKAVGAVSSGGFGPSVERGIGLAYVPPALAAPGTPLTVGPRAIRVETAEVPIYKQGTCRMRFA